MLRFARPAGVGQAIGLAWRAGPARLMAYIGLTVVSGAIPVAVSWLTKLILDEIASGKGDVSSLTRLGVALAVAGALSTVLPRATQYISEELGRAVALTADDRLYAAVNSFAGLQRFEDPAFLDRLRLAKESGGIVPGRVVAAALSLVRAVISVAGFMGALIVISPVMTLAVLAGAMPMAAAEFALSKRRARMFWRIEPMHRREFFFGSLLASVEAAKEVRLFGIGDYLRGRMRAERLSANAAQRRTAQRELLTQSGLGLVSATVSGFGLVWAVRAAGSGVISVGDVTMFVAAVAGVALALGSLVTEAAAAHYQLLMFAHYRHVVNAGPDLRPPRRPRTLAPLRGGIEFRDVWFRYSPDHPWILRGVNLFIPHGHVLGLVGLNGAGKSTVIKLLCRFYDPDRGAILWDGVDLRDVTPEELRSRISAVFQDYMSYDLTAAENIGLGDLEALEDRPRLVNAARSAGAHSALAALPQGYDTLLSRQFFSEEDKMDVRTGVSLSGGQWQRVSLARAMLRGGCDVMILDEPSSGLDAEAEHEVHRQLRRYREGRTSVLISHRLGALREADALAVLQDGLVIEFGTHDELLAQEGTYSRLFTLQAEGYHTDAGVTS